MRRAWRQLRARIERSRAARESERLQLRSRSHPPSEWAEWEASEGQIVRAWRHATQAIPLRQVTIAAVCIVAVAEVAAVGYVLGDQGGVSAAEVSDVRQFYFEKSFADARREAAARAEERGAEAGTRTGERAGRKAGARAGARRGAAAVAREQAAIAAAAAAAAAERQAARAAEREAAAEASDSTETTPTTTAPAPAPAPAPEPAPEPAEPCFDPAGFPC
jgi:hypothetical protein